MDKPKTNKYIKKIKKIIEQDDQEIIKIEKPNERYDNYNYLVKQNHSPFTK
jgi:hypothetical protein